MLTFDTVFKAKYSRHITVGAVKVFWFKAQTHSPAASYWEHFSYQVTVCHILIKEDDLKSRKTSRTETEM